MQVCPVCAEKNAWPCSTFLAWRANNVIMLRQKIDQSPLPTFMTIACKWWLIMSGGNPFFYSWFKKSVTWSDSSSTSGPRKTGTHARMFPSLPALYNSYTTGKDTKWVSDFCCDMDTKNVWNLKCNFFWRKLSLLYISWFAFFFVCNFIFSHVFIF